MEILRKGKNIITVVGIILVIFLLYKFFFKKDSGTAALTTDAGTSTSALPENAVGKELLALLLQMKSLSLDEKIFQNPAFVSLQDFGKEIVDQPRGRNNPFAPIGFDVGIAPQTPNAAAQGTSQPVITSVSTSSKSTSTAPVTTGGPIRR